MIFWCLIWKNQIVIFQSYFLDVFSRLKHLFYIPKMLSHNVNIKKGTQKPQREVKIQNWNPQYCMYGSYWPDKKRNSLILTLIQPPQVFLVVWLCSWSNFTTSHRFLAQKSVPAWFYWISSNFVHPPAHFASIGSFISLKIPDLWPIMHPQFEINKVNKLSDHYIALDN